MTHASKTTLPQSGRPKHLRLVFDAVRGGSEPVSLDAYRARRVREVAIALRPAPGGGAA